MGKVTQRTLLDFEKSSYFIEHITLDDGTKYLEVMQHYKDSKFPDSFIKINAKNLPTILYTLSQYSDGLHKPEAIIQIEVPETDVVKEIYVSKRIQEKFISNYLKGVSIKDLSMQTGYKESIVEMILIRKGIVIVPPEPPKTISKTRKRRRRKK